MLASTTARTSKTQSNASSGHSLRHAGRSETSPVQPARSEFRLGTALHCTHWLLSQAGYLTYQNILRSQDSLDL